jgi:hypothetical protein
MHSVSTTPAIRVVGSPFNSRPSATSSFSTHEAKSIEPNDGRDATSGAPG